jgi:cytochrome c peroxidase
MGGIDHQLALAVHESGTVQTYNLAGPTGSAFSAFFQSLGSNANGPAATWFMASGTTLCSAASVQQRFEASGGTDPIFRLIEGATRPTDDVSTPLRSATLTALCYRRVLSECSSQYLINLIQTRLYPRIIRSPQ